MGGVNPPSDFRRVVIKGNQIVAGGLVREFVGAVAGTDGDGKPRISDPRLRCNDAITAITRHYGDVTV